MLASIFEQLGTALAKLGEVAINAFLGALAMDLKDYVTCFPVLEDVYYTLRSASVALAVIIAGIALAKYVFASIDSSRAEDTVQSILVRTLFAGILIFMGGYILEYIVNLCKIPYDTFRSLDGITLGMADEGVGLEMVDFFGNLVEDFASLGGKIITNLVTALLQIFLTVIICWNLFKLVVEVCERWLMVGVLVYTSPLAFATIPSHSTANIFKRWMSMFVGSCIQMSISVIFLKLILSGFQMGATNSVAGVLASELDTGSHRGHLMKALLILAMCKIAQRTDTYLQQLGVGVATTGGSMLDDIIAAGRALSSGISNIAKGATAGSAAQAAQKGGILGLGANVVRTVGRQTPDGKSLGAMGQAFRDGAGIEDIMGIGRQTHRDEVNKWLGRNGAANQTQNPDGSVTDKKPPEDNGPDGKGGGNPPNNPPNADASANASESSTAAVAGAAGATAEADKHEAQESAAGGENAASNDGHDEQVEAAEAAAGAAVMASDANEGEQEGAQGAAGAGTDAQAGQPGADSETPDGVGELDPEAAAAAAAAGAVAEDGTMRDGGDGQDGTESESSANARAAAQAEQDAEQLARDSSDEFAAAETASGFGYEDKNGQWHDVEPNVNPDGTQDGWKDKETGEAVPNNANVVAKQNGYSDLKQNADGTFSDASGRKFTPDHPTYTDSDGSVKNLPQGAHASDGSNNIAAGTMLDKNNQPITKADGSNLTSKDVNYGSMTAADGSATTAKGYVGQDGNLHVLPPTAKLTSNGYVDQATGKPIVGEGGQQVQSGDLKEVAPVQRQQSPDGSSTTYQPLSNGDVASVSGGASVAGHTSPEVSAAGAASIVGVAGAASSAEQTPPVSAQDSASTNVASGNVGGNGQTPVAADGKGNSAPIHVDQEPALARPGVSNDVRPVDVTPSVSNAHVGGDGHTPAAANNARTAAGNASQTSPVQVDPEPASTHPVGSGNRTQPVEVAPAATSSVGYSGNQGTTRTGETNATDAARSTSAASEVYTDADSGGRQSAEREQPRGSAPDDSGQRSAGRSNDGYETVEGEVFEPEARPIRSWSDAGQEARRLYDATFEPETRRTISNILGHQAQIWGAVGEELSPGLRERNANLNGLEYNENIANAKANMNQSIYDDTMTQYSHESPSQIPQHFANLVADGRVDKLKGNTYDNNFTQLGCGYNGYEGNPFTGINKEGEETLSDAAKLCGTYLEECTTPDGKGSWYLASRGNGKAIEYALSQALDTNNWKHLTQSTGDNIGGAEIMLNTANNIPYASLENVLRYPVKDGQVIQDSPLLDVAANRICPDMCPDMKPGTQISNVKLSSCGGKNNDGFGNKLHSGNRLDYDYINTKGESVHMTAYTDLAMTAEHSGLVKKLFNYRSRSGRHWGITGQADIEVPLAGTTVKNQRGIANLIRMVKSGRVPRT